MLRWLVFALPLVLAAGPAHTAVAPKAGVEGPAPALVLEVQRGLGAIGLYRGPIDGLMSPALAEAIRTYQRQRNLPVDGSVSAELVVHLGGIAEQAAVLRARIDATRARQIEEAERALDSAPGIAALVAGGESMRDLACPREGMVPCLAAIAAAAVERVEDGERRDWALLRLASVLAAVDRESLAWGLVRRIGDARTRVSAVRDIAIALAHAGREERAAELAALIPLARPRAEAWIAVAEASARRAEEGRRKVAVAAARQAIAVIEEDHQRIALLARLATLVRLPPEQGDLAIALDVARGLSTGADRDLALGHIATAQASLGDLDSALATVAMIGEAHRRGPVLVRAVVSAAETGNWERGVELVGAIEEPRYRVVAGARLAASLAEAGREATAAELVSAASALMASMQAGYARDYGLRALVTAELALGRAAEARAATARIGSGLLRAEAYVELAGARGSSTGGEAGAGVAIDAIPDPVERLTLEMRLALLEGDDERPRSVAAEAEALTDDWQRARALTALAEVLAAGWAGR